MFDRSLVFAVLFFTESLVRADESSALIAACRSAMQQTESLLSDGEMTYSEEIHFLPSGQRDVMNGRIAWDVGFRYAELKRHHVREGKIDDEDVKVVKTKEGALSIVSKHVNDGDRTVTLASYWAEGSRAKIYDLYFRDLPALWFDERLKNSSKHVDYFQDRPVSPNGRVTYDRKIELRGEEIECRIAFGTATKIRMLFALNAGGNLVLRECEEPANRYYPNGEHSRITYEWEKDESGRWYPKRTIKEVGSGLKDGKLASVAMRHSFTVTAMSKRKMEIPRTVKLTTLGEIPEGAMVSETRTGGAIESYVFRADNGEGIEETLKRQASDLQKKGLGAKADPTKK